MPKKVRPPARELRAAEAARAELARRGTLAFLLRPHQLPIYALFRRDDRRTVVANVSRQTGKSFVATVVAVEECLRRPGIFVQFVAPTARQMRSILLPRMRQVIQHVPEDIRPKVSSADCTWTFPNGSIIQYDGADSDQAEALRGRSADLAFIDEAGHVDDLRYLVDDVLRPMFIVTKGRLVVYSTPPDVPGHHFPVMCARAETEGAYLRMTVRDNGFASEDEIKEWAEQSGGEDSATFRREYLCEFVVDEQRVVFPEFQDNRSKVIRPVAPRGPELGWFAVDWGFRDPNGLLWGYWDFRRARLVVQAELVLRGVTTQEMAREIRRVEHDLWQEREPSLRISDVDLQILMDMQSMHGLSIRPVTKESLEAMVNEVRVWLEDGRIEIDPSCTALIAQLSACAWDRQRKRFVRQDGHHFDLCAALVYAVRSIDSIRHTNPYPSDPFDRYGQVRWGRPVDSDPDVEALGHLWRR